MKGNRLGASALEVTEFCLGTVTWGEQNTESEAHAQIARALGRSTPADLERVNRIYPSPATQ